MRWHEVNCRTQHCTILRLALHAETSDLPTGVKFVLSKMGSLDVDFGFKEIYDVYREILSKSEGVVCKHRRTLCWQIFYENSKIDG